MQPELIFKYDVPSDYFQNIFNGYIGNENAVAELIEIAKESFDNEVGMNEGVKETNRVCYYRLSIEGPPSVGKTTLVRKFAQALDLPYIETDGKNVSSPEKLWELISETCDDYGIPLEIDGNDANCPPLIIFIDEVHLESGRVQDSLLKATEINDGLLITSLGNLDCKKVTFIIGSTDSGKLRPAFKSRFTRISLVRHTVEQVSEIIKLGYPNIDDEAALEIAKIKKLPREALDFAKRVMRYAKQNGIFSFEAFGIIKKRDGISDDGMNGNVAKVIQLLQKNPNGLSASNISKITEIDSSELDNEIFPQLLEDGKITIGNKVKLND